MRRAVLALSILCSIPACAQSSSHREGPHGLEAWTVSQPEERLASQGPLPTELLIARKGRVIRRLRGGPFFWNLIFLQDGQQLAYTHGPLHFAMTCSLIQISTGRKIADHDCFSEQPDTAPLWVKQLLAAPDLQR